MQRVRQRRTIGGPQPPGNAQPSAEALRLPLRMRQSVGAAELRAAGNRAAARLLQGDGGLGVQRVFTVRTAQGPLSDIGQIRQAATMAFQQQLLQLQARDQADFDHVWSNATNGLERTFDRYLSALHGSPGLLPEFDLGQVDEVVRLYGELKRLVLHDNPRNVVGPNEAPANAAFTPGGILFASGAGGRIGSIYFAGGRLRLLHGRGPKISEHAGIERFTISDLDYQNHWAQTLTPQDARQLQSCRPATIGTGERLIEFWPEGGGYGRHPSRGGPVAFNYTLTQAQLNIIYRACQAGDNDGLRRAMASDPVLAQIPLATP